MATPFFDIQESDFASLKDKVVLITGCSSGIGLATTKLALSAGAKVVGGDINPIPLESSSSLVFQKVDVADWKSQTAFFKKAIESFGRIDHVYANAGIGLADNFVTDKFDDDGELMPPNMRVMDVNLNGVIYSCKLGVHYMRRNGQDGGSVVITGSASSFVPFFITDYGTSKHAVLGLMRGLNDNLRSTPIRINCVTPLWTASGLAKPELIKDKLGLAIQPASAVGKSALWLMADDSRRGMTIFSRREQFREMDQALLGTAVHLMDTSQEDGPQDPLALQQMMVKLAQVEGQA